MATAAQVVADFQNPVVLLRRYWLAIAGGAKALPNGPAVIRTFKVAIDDNLKATGFTVGKFLKSKSRPFVKIDFYKEGVLNKFNQNVMSIPVAPKHDNALGADEFNAYYVPMAETKDVGKGSSHYTLPTVGGPDIMITSRLSGCRFAIGSSNDQTMLVSHIAPDKSVGSDTRQQDMLNHVSQGFANMKASFSIGDQYLEYAAIIGKRVGQQWTFYCQSQRTGANSSRIIDSVKVIDG